MDLPYYIWSTIWTAAAQLEATEAVYLLPVLSCGYVGDMLQWPTVENVSLLSLTDVCSSTVNDCYPETLGTATGRFSSVHFFRNSLVHAFSLQHVVVYF